jgi:MFS family permease
VIDSVETPMEKPVNPAGFRTFLTIWAGQLVSLLGSNLTGFALGIWVYQQHGSVTEFALISLFNTLPGILLSPIAGALVDRWDRRRAMILSDTGSALATLALAVAFLAGRLDVWMIYLATGINSLLSAIQWPAYTAATTLLVPKRDFARAAALRNLGATIGMVSPALGGALLVSTGIKGIFVIDLATFVFALATLLAVRVPAPPAARGSLWREAAVGWTVVHARKGLFALLLLAAMGNLSVGFIQSLGSPMLLGFASARAVGTAVTVASLGMLAGNLLMTFWRGLRRQVDVVLAFTVLSTLAAALSGLRPSLVLFTACTFVFFFGQSVSGASAQAIWQSKVEPDLQGRVFATRRLVGWSTLPLAYAVAGPLADKVFEPLLAPGGALAGALGPLIGVGKGRGIALLLCLSGLIFTVATLAFYLSPRLRRVEEELPDQVAD